MADENYKSVAEGFFSTEVQRQSEELADSGTRNSESEVLGLGFSLWPAGGLENFPTPEDIPNEGSYSQIDVVDRFLSRGTNGSWAGDRFASTGMADLLPRERVMYGGSDLELAIGSGSSDWHASSSRKVQKSGEISTHVEERNLDEEPCVGLEQGNPDHNVQHKRPKVLFNSQKFHCASKAYLGADSSGSIYGDIDVSQCLPHSSRSDIIQYFNPLPSGGNGGNSIDSGGGGSDAVDGCNVLKMDDFENRMDLTDDLLHMVFSFLGHTDLCRAAGVCRQWRTASAHEDFWKCLNFEYRNISATQFTEMCQRYPNATEINILGAPSIDTLVMEAMVSLRNIETLTVGKGQLGDAFFHALSDCHALTRLVICEASLGNGLQEIQVFHERLRHLQIVKCRVLRISLRCPKLETLSLRRTNMAHALLTCSQLRDLDIASCHKLSDAGIRSAVTSCLLLASLDMSNCACVSDETLREIALACVNLRVLNASYCPNISLESVRLPMLRDLKLQSCEGITSASMTAIAHSFMLEELELDCCGLLTSVSLDLPRMRNIRLRHCRKFVDLNLHSPLLSSITVSNCPALLRINIISNSLQKLVLQKQESLTSLSLQCNRLQEVDLTECESLTNSICQVFSDGGGCPILRSLVLDSCENLTMVGFSSTTLVDLSLVSCRAMTSLHLACPNLQQVQLDGCDHLEKASFCPVGLRSLNLGICPKLSTLQIEAPQMTVLELKGCGVLSQAIIDCPHLTSLDASFCSQLTDDCLSATAVSCPLIESLILMSCPSVGPEGLSSLSWLTHLTLLDLSYTFLTNLQPVFETCLQLKVLKLQACKYLTNSSLDALYTKGALAALCELDLSYGTICQSAIEELLACCTHLTHVSLNGCVNMHDLDWGSRGPCFSDLSTTDNPQNCHVSIEPADRLLQNLNCVGCPNIKKVVIPPLAHCFHLSTLNLSLSANLKEVDLACSNLNFLNLSNCCSLEFLKLECPRLTSLFLQSCNIEEEAVETAISHCNMLETLDIRYCPKIYAVCLARLRLVCPSLKRIFNSLSM
ncbi:F-box/LRR-repeat protein 15-like isoform X2 [Aristolochia californica]|uniref:F-box/LRR-repeat protein 15-like isoform X2 n=1 Tax=Aristolochia californica TaxID=171875 RepID=UPI0035D8CEE0